MLSLLQFLLEFELGLSYLGCQYIDLLVFLLLLLELVGEFAAVLLEPMDLFEVEVTFRTGGD